MSNTAPLPTLYAAISCSLKRTFSASFSLRPRTLLLAALLAGSQVSAQQAYAQSDVVLDEIAAVVNDGVVLESDINVETSFLLQRSRSVGQAPPSAASIREQVLNQLIDREVQRQRAASLGIEVDQGSINSAIEKVAAGNNMNSFEFRQSLQQQGFDYAYYRKGITHELLVARLVRREVRDSITVTEKEIDDYLASKQTAGDETQQYSIRHIVIAMPRSSNAAGISRAQFEAEQAVAQLRGGADFAELAVRLSDGPRASDGGNLGWREAPELPNFINDVLPGLKRGDISNPVQSDSGFHIVKLEGIRDGAQAEVAEEIRLRHIFLDTESDIDDAAARNTLLALRERIVAGESFAELAAEFSQDPDTRANGGELPWLAGGQMPIAMDRATASLPTGRLSQPFRTQFGWHIAEILERREGNADNSRARNDASQVLRQEKFAQEVERWQRTLREESFVEVLK